VWEYEEGHTVKTDEEWGHIRQAAQHRRQTATFLCQRVKAQLDQLAKRRYRLRESLAQLRKLQRALRYAQAGQHDRETAALINILQRMSMSSQF
jgi:hypothetical protein